MKSRGGGRERRASRRLDVVCVCVALGPTNDSLRRSDESFECCQPAECEIGADAVFFFWLLLLFFYFFFSFFFFFLAAPGAESPLALRLSALQTHLYLSIDIFLLFLFFKKRRPWVGGFSVIIFLNSRLISLTKVTFNRTNLEKEAIQTHF